MRRKVYEAVRPLLSDIKEGLHIILFAKTINIPTNYGLASAPALGSNVNGLDSKLTDLKSDFKSSGSNRSLTGAIISNDLKGLFVKAGILR